MHGRPTQLLLVAALALCGCSRPARPNVLLISIDTLRADRVAARGSERKTTPNIDALAAEGLRFTHAQSPRAKTTPAIASMMTGLYPHEHGVRDLLMPLDAGVPVLAERFQQAGYTTGAIIGNYVLKDRFSGLARGFDHWVEDLPQQQGVPPDDVAQRSARSLTDGALAALRLGDPSGDGASPREAFVHGTEPWFLWLHYMDPHGSYDPPAEHRIFTRTTPDPIPADPGAQPGEISRYYVALYNAPDSTRMPDGRIDAALVRDLYDGEVHYVDAQIGRLLDRLRAQGRLENTIVVITADHGESLGEHRYWFEHGRDAYEVTCRVPLVLRLPAQVPGLAGRPQNGVRAADVSLADIGPTLLELAGLPPLFSPVRKDDAIRGMSRAYLLHAEPQTTYGVFSEKVERAERSGAVQFKAVRIGDWKYIRRYAQFFDDGKAQTKELHVLSDELYDLAHDPGETRNLIATPPAEARLALLQAALLSFSSADLRFPDLGRALQLQREKLGRDDPDTLRKIEALGY